MNRLNAIAGWLKGHPLVSMPCLGLIMLHLDAAYLTWISLNWFSAVWGLMLAFLTFVVWAEFFEMLEKRYS